MQKHKIFNAKMQEKEAKSMARPTKSVATRTGHMSKKDIDTRLEYEAKLRGDADKIRPPSFLTLPQRKIFKGLIDYLMPAGLLGNIDVHIVAQAAITINRVQECERIINETGLVDDEGNINPQIKIKSGYISERYGVVYKITNVINNKVYIGVTTKTFRERYSENLAKTTHNKHLKNSIKKYGIENFVINEEFDVAYSVEELNEKEQYYIKKYDAMSPNKGYNKVSGGVIGYQYSEQTKLKMSEANTRKKIVYQYMLNGNYIGEYTL